MENTLAVNEIFHSLQGESSQAGRPSVFVRLMGCPLRCTYCDTEYAFYEGRKMPFNELYTKVESYGCKLVEVTGGEPLAQPNVLPFMEGLLARGFEVMLETGGAHSIAAVPQGVRIILDIKTPGSGENAKQLWANVPLLKSGMDEVKFVITNRADFDYACGVAREHRLFERHTVLLSPANKTEKTTGLDNHELAAWALESRLPWRFQLQMHKFIWGAEARGV